jgi:chromosomal replication initiator protein
MESLWQDCLLHFERELPSQQFQTWFRPLELLRIDQDGQTSRVVLAAPTRFKQGWAKNQFTQPLSSWWSKTLGTPVELEIEVSGTADEHSQAELPAAQAQQTPQSTNHLAGQTASIQPGHPNTHNNIASPETATVDSQRQQSRLNQDWTFDTFVPGKANQLARAAALQVAENPGKGYNPLFLYGGVGLGKSHLIHAVGNALLTTNRNARVRYIHAEAYVSDVVKAYQKKSFDEFKRYYHALDLLLIDDIQFFAGKQRTQEEFFYAFEALIAAQKQIIITSDTYPTELGEINPRLVTRFASGLTVAIEPPELEMRVAILMKKANQESFPLPEEEAFFIAKQLRSNVRELEGALKKIIAYCGFHQTTPSMEVVKEALRDLLSIQKTLISVENIQKTVADFYNIKVADMYSKRRPANIAMPRQIAMYLAKELTQKSFPDIGDLFGGRDHTTVLHAVKKVSEQRLRNTELNHQLHILEQQLKG